MKLITNQKLETEEERRKVWDEIFESKFSVKKYGGNTYITFMGMYIKLSKGRTYLLNRETKEFHEVDELTLQPLKPKCEKRLIDRSEGYEKYGS